MKRFDTKLAVALSSVFALGLVACGDDDPTIEDSGVHPDATTTTDSGPRPDAATPDAGTPDTGVVPDAGPQPDAGFIRLNFSIDDSANQTYTSTDGLAWKGSFAYDDETNVVLRNTGWTGPFPLLHDDGPWDQGGHEPAGATAGDNIWGTSILFAVPSEDAAFDYGAIRGSVDGSDGQWIWQGTNGTFTVSAGQTTDVTATGLTIAAFGEIDLRLTIDTSSLAAEFSEFNPANGIAVKGSAWAWQEIGMVDDGTEGDETAADGIYTFVFSEHIGRHDGLLNSGDEPQFVFMLGGVEYKVGGAPSQTGVAAYTQAPNDDWVEQTIENQAAGDQNTYITVP